MKVCYFVSTPSVEGGANRSLIDLIRQLKQDDKAYSAVVIISGHGTMETALNELGITCHVVPFANSVKSQKAWRTAGKRIYNILARKRIKQIIMQEDPDIIHNNSLPTTIGMEVAMKEKIPYICHIRENIWEGLGMELYAPRKVKETLNKAAYVIAISDYILNSYRNFYNNQHSIVINDGLTIEDYYSPNRIILNGQNVNVIIVGVVNPQKGQKEAVEAVEKLINDGYKLHLTILGGRGRWCESTEYADNLIDYVQEHNLNNIEFVEPINNLQELKELRNNNDINLICSSAEGLGRTTIESMLSGALTIAADKGATPEIINNLETGMLYTSGVAKHLADQIEWAIKHREEARTIAQNGQRYAAKRFSIQTYAEKIWDIYESILEK